MEQVTKTNDKGANKVKKTSPGKRKSKVKEEMSEKKERTLRALGFIK